MTSQWHVKVLSVAYQSFQILVNDICLKNSLIRILLIELISFLQEEYQRMTGGVANLNKLIILRTIGMLFIPIASIIPFFIPPFDITVVSIIHDITFSIFLVHELCIILYWLFTSKAIELIANQYENNFTKLSILYRFG